MNNTNIILNCNDKKRIVKNITVQEPLACSLVNNGQDDLIDLGYTIAELKEYKLNITSSNCSKCEQTLCNCTYQTWTDDHITYHINMLKNILEQREKERNQKVCELCGLPGCQFGCYHD